MPVLEDITRDLTDADTVVEATIGDEGRRRYALEAGARICSHPAIRAARVDSAVLVGFIFNTTRGCPDADYDEIAARIVAEFRLDEVAR